MDREGCGLISSSEALERRMMKYVCIDRIAGERAEAASNAITNRKTIDSS